MLTLENALHIEGYTVYRDDVSPTTFFLLPDAHAPTIARTDEDQGGRPIFSLIVYRKDEDRVDEGEDYGGGIMTFTAEIPVPEKEFKKVKGKLRGLVYGEDAEAEDDVDLTTVPFTEGRVTVAVAGEAAGLDGTVEEGEFTRSILGNGKVSGIGASRKSIMAKLTQDGAALFSQITNLATIPITVQYDLVFEHRLVGVEMRVWATSISSAELIKVVGEEDYYHDEYLDDEVRQKNEVKEVTETLTRTRNLGVTVIPGTSEVDDETLLTLEKYGLDMVNKELEKMVEASPPTDAQRQDQYLEKFVSNATNRFNFTLTRQMVLTRDFVPSGALTDVFQDGVDDLITFVDLRTGFFEHISIPVRVNADFARLGIDSVTVTVTYRSRTRSGERTTETESFNIRDAATIGLFTAYANTLDEVKYDWQAKVFYQDTQDTLELEATGVVDRFLVVSVGDLGLLDVSVGAGLVLFEEYPRANVSLRYTTSDDRVIETELLISESDQTQSWIAPIGERRAGSYEYKVDWIDTDGRIVPGDWIESDSDSLRVDAPVPERMSVSVAASGDFGGDLVQVLCNLHYEDAANGYVREGQLTFNSDKQVQGWDVALRNPELRDYSYHYVLVYAGGRIKRVPEEGSLPGEPGFIVVGERYDLEVELYPALLSFGDDLRIAIVEVTAPDAANEQDKVQSFFFQAGSTDAQVFRADLVEGGSARYHLEITYHRGGRDPEVEVISNQTSDKFLVPPPKPLPVDDGE